MEPNRHYVENENESPESMLADFENDVRSVARRHAPDDFCAWCVENTPLARESARDAYTLAPEVEDLAVEAMETWKAMTGDEMAYWVENDLYTVYEETYFAECADPAECEVCQHPDAYDKCGHIDHGEECPVRGGK